MRTTIDRMRQRKKKRWASKRRWVIRRWYTIDQLCGNWRKDPKRRLYMKRGRLWVRSHYGLVI